MGTLKYTVPTDEKHVIEVESSIVTAAWSRGSAYAGQEAPFQITTAFVGQGAKIVVEGKSQKGVKLGKITGKIFYNDFREAFTLPPDLERGDKIQFTVELPDNDLWAQGDSIPVYPMIGVHNLKWSAEEALDGDELNLTADVSQIEEETDALVTIYRYDPKDAHERITSIPTKVKDKKIDIQWVCRYGDSLKDLPTKEEIEKRGGTYEKPKYFFTVQAGNTEYGKEDQASKFVTRPIHSAQYIEIEDLLFNYDSALLLPEGVSQGGKSKQKAVNGHDVFVLAHKFVQEPENSDKKLIIAGHTDTAGDPTYNAKLSLLRAQAIKYVLVGQKEDRDDWMSQFKSDHKDGVSTYQPQDVQMILNWAVTAFGFSCGPNVVDGQIGPKTKDNIKRFKTDFNNEFAPEGSDKQLDPKTDKMDDKDWGAVFDLYSLKIDERLADLQLERGEFQWVDDHKKAIGCGELWPLEKIESRKKDKAAPYDTDKKASENRRVELLFLDPDEAAELSLACDPGKCTEDNCQLYGKLICENRFTRYIWEVEGDQLLFRYRILDSQYQPAACLEYVMRIKRDQTIVPLPQKHPRTDGDGMIVELIPKYATSVLLEIPKLAFQCEVLLGELDELSPDNKTSIQQRLYALEFLTSADYEAVTEEELKDAVRSFQLFCQDNSDKGEPRITNPGRSDGEIDGATIESLKSYYGG